MKAVEIDFKTSTQATNLKKKKKKHQNHVRNDAPSPVSASHALGSHLVCALGLALSFWATHSFFSTNLISDPVHTLLLIWVSLISSLLLIPNILISLRFWLVFFCGFFFFFNVCRSLKPRSSSLFIVGFERIRKNARWVVLFYFIFLIFLVYGCLVAGKRKIKRKVGFWDLWVSVCFVYWGWESWHWHNRDTGMHEAIEYFESFISMVLFGCSENAERKKIGFW